jgi:peptidoglycan L-alanyl-D-glutamate endopeptidase CwlK
MDLSTISIHILDTCDKRLKHLALEAIKESPYQFIITCGYRTEKEQQKLYAQGRTLPGKIVTRIDGVIQKSMHNFWPARAFDIAVMIDNKITWDTQFYKIVAEHIKKVADKLGIKINWGGDWSEFKDYPHFEIL